MEPSALRPLIASVNATYPIKSLTRTSEMPPTMVSLMCINEDPAPNDAYDLMIASTVKVIIFTHSGQINGDWYVFLISLYLTLLALTSFLWHNVQ